MIVNGKEIIKKQLEAKETETVIFDDKNQTNIVPAHLRPVPDNSKLSLDGEWNVKFYPFEEKEAEAVSSFNDFEKIQQPGKVFYADPEAHKEEIPNWNRVSLDHIDENDGALLVKKIVIPEEWIGKNIFLRFDAIYPAGIIYLNGVKLGVHYSGLTPVEFDISDKLVPGKEAIVTIRLLRKHKFVKMDMPRHSLEFAGLAQSAYFYATEQSTVKDYHLITDLDETLTVGKISGTVTIDNPKSEQLSVSVVDADGIEVGSWGCDTDCKQNEYEVEFDITNPLLWNDEYPNLYTVKIELGNSHSFSYRTGFRKLELSPEGAKLNGNFIKFRGVNHLTFHPEYGMHTPKEWLRKNMDLMKKANVNCIRTHFTGPSDFVDLCDEMGFYLLQELPIDWGTNYIHDPEWVGPALMRLEGAIRRDRHHPSIMVWSVGNENMPESAKVAADGWNHLAIYDAFCKMLDPSRPTMFPPPGPANKIEGIFELRVGDIADIHYSFKLQKKFNELGVIKNPNSWEADMVTINREEALERGWSGCWCSSEYGLFSIEPDLMNAPYLSVVADKKTDPLSGQNTLEVFHERLKDEWGNMRHDPSCLGGAYFPWLCAGVGKSPEENPWGWTRWGEDANWGVITADLLPKPQYWSMRVLFAPVWFPSRVSWKIGDEYISFQISNHYNSINLSQCTLRIQQNSGGTWMCMVRDFKDIKLSCAPGETIEAKIPIWHEGLKKSLQNGNFGYCRCTLLDPSGFCPVKADILIIPEDMQQKDEIGMPIGPDAIL